MTAQAQDVGLAGLRVLVVEDSLLVADMIAELLEDAGVTVVGPVGRVPAALALAEREALDGALLDVNLAGQHSGPIAAALHIRGIPFIFLTGYSDAGALPAEFRDMPQMAKPFRQRDLEARMVKSFRPGQA